MPDLPGLDALKLLLGDTDVLRVCHELGVLRCDVFDKENDQTLNPYLLIVRQGRLAADLFQSLNSLGQPVPAIAEFNKKVAGKAAQDVLSRSWGRATAGGAGESRRELKFGARGRKIDVQ
jgi:hypothetical protein